MKFFLFLLLLLPLASNAQEFFNFLSPDSPSTTLELEGVYLPDIGITQRIYEDDQNQVSVGAKHQKIELTAESQL